jgi:ABC-type branched-subunit amino acid transport system permease subunit
MQINFLYHIIISWSIFYLLTAGAKIYLKLRWSFDFSYLGIVIFGSYAWVLANIHREMWMLVSFIFACVVSLVFTFFVLYLSSKLTWLYFTIGTLALYMLFYQAAYNLEFITWWAFGLTGMSKTLVWWFWIEWLLWYMFYAAVCTICVIGMLLYIKRTYLYTILQAWGEREVVVKSLWVSIVRYKLFMILLTTFLAVLWWNLYSFYFGFIDPNSFWLPMLILVLVIVFGSYKFNEIWTYMFSIWVIALYEWLRFFKFVDPWQIWYVREVIFALIILGTSFRVFRTTSFWRQE